LKPIIKFLAFLIFVSILWTCSKPNDPGAIKTNLAPKTKLGNIPPDDPKGQYPVFALVKLYWTGSDEDGYIVAFKYRWSYLGNNNEVIWKDWKTIPTIDSLGEPLDNANSASFVFESNKDLNPHTFQIKAIDNEGAEDPNPATLAFWTTKAIPPATEIKSAPDPALEVFMGERVTETWSGIKFTFGGTDDDGQIVDYSYKVDNKPWTSFNINTEAILTSADISEPLTGTHTLTVKARDNTLIEDQNPPSTTFNVVVPTWEKQVLLLDNTRDGVARLGSPSDNQVDSFYIDIMNAKNRTSYDLWDIKQKGGFPDKKTLGKYRILLWYDDLYQVDLSTQISVKDLATLNDYLFVGGKLIVSGWQASNMFATPAIADSFFYKFAHINLGLTDIPNRDFQGAIGLNGYPSITVDPDKMPSSWSGLLDRIQIMSPRGFGETIYTLDLSSKDPLYQGKPVAVRYIGTTYNVVFFSFPLYFMNKTAAANVLDRALKDMGEN
jgi:hypothetical protein